MPEGDACCVTSRRCVTRLAVHAPLAVPRRNTKSHRQARCRALNARDLLNTFGNSLAELIDVIRLELHDDIVRTSDGVHRHDARRTGLCVLQAVAHRLSMPHFGFDKNVASNHQPFPLIASFRFRSNLPASWPRYWETSSQPNSFQ